MMGVPNIILVFSCLKISQIALLDHALILPSAFFSSSVAAQKASDLKYFLLCGYERAYYRGVLLFRPRMLLEMQLDLPSPPLVT